MKKFIVKLVYIAEIEIGCKARNQAQAITKARAMRSRLYDENYEQWLQDIERRIEPDENSDVAEEA
jgi:hypothetical protein